MFKKTNLFKTNNYPSWSINEGEGSKVFINQCNQATSWPEWLAQVKKCSKLGTGYKIETYKTQRKGTPIKKVVPNKSRVFVKVKNKPNNIKAVEYLGKYAQHKPLLNEVIKTLDFLDK